MGYERHVLILLHLLLWGRSCRLPSKMSTTLGGVLKLQWGDMQWSSPIAWGSHALITVRQRVYNSLDLLAEACHRLKNHNSYSIRENHHCFLSNKSRASPCGHQVCMPSCRSQSWTLVYGHTHPKISFLINPTAVIITNHELQSRNNRYGGLLRSKERAQRNDITYQKLRCRSNSWNVYTYVYLLKHAVCWLLLLQARSGHLRSIN